MLYTRASIQIVLAIALNIEARQSIELLSEQISMDYHAAKNFNIAC